MTGISTGGVQWFTPRALKFYRPRARLLLAALGSALALPTEPELRLLHRWLDCWRRAVKT